MKKLIYLLVCIFVLTFFTSACSLKNTENDKQNALPDTMVQSEKVKSPTVNTTIMIAVAASLEYCLKNDIIPKFEAQNPVIKVEGTYDSSGKLQTQIEEGMEADLFFSAATKQMDTLEMEGLIIRDTRIDLLNNKIVLITPSDSRLGINKFQDIGKAGSIAIGDPDSVPAGQYAKEALSNLKLWNKISGKISMGTSVTEVMNWVAEGSADAGIVYTTDAAANPGRIKIIAEAPEGSLKQKVIYPVAVLRNSKNQEIASRFVDFLNSSEVINIFKKNGFTIN